MKRRRVLVLVAALSLGLVFLFWQPWQTRLKVIRSGGKGPPSFMLLHGYGSAAEHWLPYAQTIAMPSEGRFLFPEGPVAVSRKDGLLDGRAWWNLNLASHLRPGKLGVDLTSEDPRGLERAARLVRRELAAEGNSAKQPFILGGFSQGAMVSCQVAFASDEPLAALVILSGTPVDRAGWRTQMAKRKGLPVFMSHGRADNILPFDLAERLRAELVDAGLAVTFVPFEAGHQIPAEVVVALNDFLARLKR